MNDNLDDNLDENAAEIVRRFEQYLSGESTGYFDVEELETISEYYLHKGRTKDSDRAIDLGLRLHPASSELQIKRAKTYLAAGEIHKALATLERLSDPNDYEAQLLRIDALCKLNRTEEAELLADHLLGGYDSDIDNICLDIAFVFQGQEKFGIAHRFLLVGDKANPNNIDLLFELAYCQEQLEQLDKALETYNRILDLDAYVGEAWFNVGQIYFLQGAYEKALEAYDFYLAIDENDMFTWLQKAHVHFLLKQYQQAVDCYQQYNQYATEKWQTNTFIGECYEKMEDYGTALSFYRQSVEEAPDNYDGYVGIAICLLETDRYKESIPVIEKAIGLRPDAYEAYVYLAEAYSNLDDLEKSAEAYRKSLSIEPAQADTLMAYGNLLMDMNRWQDAIECYRQAATIDPDTEHVDLMLAIAYAKAGEYDIAFNYLDQISSQGQKLDLFFELCPEISDYIIALLRKRNDKQ